jgi:hypothetical protein
MPRNWLILLLLLAASCRESRKTIPAFYYWKTVYKPTNYERQRLNELQCKTMYLRFFDVDWNEVANKPVPVSSLRMPQQMDTGFSYIPTIFITQKTVARLRKEDVAPLAKNIAALAESICVNAGIKPQEMQIDCDWTYRSREQYFTLLRELKKQAFFKGKTLSCTIRLFQVKFVNKSGLPPVDKGMLMCYNMGNMKRPGTKNSILDFEEGKQYLKQLKDYSLPLDIALPLFDWPLLFRNGELKGILRDISVQEVKSTAFFQAKNEYSFSCRADTFWKGYYFRKGDLLRLEDSEYEEIVKIANYTAKRLGNREMRLAFFHCDSVTLSKYSSDELEKVVDIYR